MTDSSPPAAAPAAPSRAPGWWTMLMSGVDNQTPAIGRVLGGLLAVNCLALIPAVIVGVLLCQHEKWPVWSGFLMAMAAYVPAIVGSITVLIRATNPTEPGYRP